MNTPGTYTAKENISAFFGELDFHLKKMDIVTGIRNEHTHQLVTSSAPPVDGLGQQVKISYTDWLPSLHLRYALNEKQNLRFSYYKAISRPALYDITFFNMSYDDYTVAGNPFLKHSTANNLDLRYELYMPEILDELQVTAFYKQIKNPYEKSLLNASDTLYPVPSGGLSYTPATKITEQLRNFGTAYNYGLDISLVKNVGNIGIAGNYTFTSSHITQSKKYKQREVPGNASSDIVTVTRLQKRPLQGQSQHIANISVSYRIPRWGYTTQLTGFYTGKRIENISGWYNMDNWQKGYTTLNLSMEKTLNRHWRIFAKVNNLLNATPVIYMNSAVTGIPEQLEKGKPVIEKTYTYRQYLIGVVLKL
ncbi:MAG TPA: TonB-dependent receptor [Chitinophagaceae bacterium]|nr:TonB-dependent receptor [Chitinophagaceae bacterium]